jgi:hypothetical protein
MIVNYLVLAMASMVNCKCIAEVNILYRGHGDFETKTSFNEVLSL